MIDDIPEAMNAAGFNGVRPYPIGCAPRIPRLVADALSDEAALSG